MSTGSDAARSALIERLQGALDALERGDEDLLRQEVGALTAERERTRALVQGLSRLARELNQTLGELPAVPGASDLGDAGARLEHVVAMTEQASHRTMDLAEECRDLADRLRAELDGNHAETLEQLRHNLSEIVLTQSFQDLSSQIIRRVADIVRRMHDGFGELGLPPRDEAGNPAGGKLAGPSIAGLDNGFSQDDADALLSGLGI